MGQPYVGEIRMFAGNFAPNGWLMCDGSLQPISEYETLYNLIGTTYGGDGQSTFGLPDLRGRVPVHQGQGSGLSPRVIGELAGAESVMLTGQQIPVHEHPFMATSAVGSVAAPSGALVAQSPQIQMYIEDAPDTNMSPNAVSLTGGNSAHNNMMPYICINYIISMYGIFPSQS